jgi:hypothetical protein
LIRRRIQLDERIELLVVEEKEFWSLLGESPAYGVKLPQTMKPIIRRLIWVSGGLVLLLAAVEAFDSYTAGRRNEEFFRRTGPISEGMTESAVRAIAGAPNRFVSDMASLTDPHSVAGGCREAHAAAVMVYSGRCGWVCEYLDPTPVDVSSIVVCLNDRRIVVTKYLHIVRF